MTIALSSSKCFDAVSNALLAVNCGKPLQAANILHSVKRDAKLMQNGLRKYHEELQKIEGRYENTADCLTEEINQLYQQEQEWRKQERELEGLKARLHLQNESNAQSRDRAERRYNEARNEEQRAREKRELHEVLFWIPIVNIFAAIVEAIEENGARAREAMADMQRYQRNWDEANSDIRATNSRIRNIQAKIFEVQREALSLKQQRDRYHNDLIAVKSAIVFLLDASTVSSEILSLTQSAEVKTESLDRVMRLAAKKNSLKVLKSGGIKTKVGSFKECWEKIADMVQSNSLLSLDEELYLDY